MAKRKKQKSRKILTDIEKKELAEKFLNGKMIKQLANDYSISIQQGYDIIKELLEWKLEWKNKEILNEVPNG